MDFTELKQKEKQEIKTPAKREYKLIGSVRNRPGLKYWAFNLISYVLKEVQMQHEIKVNHLKKPITTHKVQHEANTVYFFALNRKNAEKKIERRLGLSCNFP
ncbi:MAG: hypothetical protein LBM67_08415 [Lentimicrobiaceae bacterium]|jgi:hypothetical protein|nr:hypothetical protein [Lentimicrobiaceae bacterium]